MIPDFSRRSALGLIAALALWGPWSGPGRAEASPSPAPQGCTGHPSATWIDVAVEGVANSNGLIAITLYADNPRKFLIRHGSLYVGRVPAQAGTTVGCIFVPQPGVYALAIYHDENASQTFDRTALGLPAEAYGFSNNPSTLAGLPSFRSVRLAIPRSGLLTRIRLTYP
ncbi:MAG TPA: DUF2141 domain-containing protein [Novosphingobium sp.]